MAAERPLHGWDASRREEKSELRSDWQAEARPTTDGFPERTQETKLLAYSYPGPNRPDRISSGILFEMTPPKIKTAGEPFRFAGGLN